MNKNALIEFYLDYVNNYVSTARIAEDYGFTVEFARAAIAEGRRLHELRVEQEKMIAESA